MRAISPHARFSLQLIEAPVKRGLDSSGNVVEYADTKPVIANFAQTGLHEWEQLAVLEYFNFSGLPEGVNPLSTVAVYDSEAQALALGWDAVFLAQVDARLAHLAVQNPTSFIVVPAPEKRSPWKSYDSQDVATIFRLFLETGAEAETVRLYEYENQARPEILEAMEAIQDGGVAEDVLKVAATEPDESHFKIGSNDGEAPLGPIEPKDENPFIGGVLSGVATDQRQVAPASVEPIKTDPLAGKQLGSGPVIEGVAGTATSGFAQTDQTQVSKTDASLDNTSTPAKGKVTVDA